MDKYREVPNAGFVFDYNVDDPLRFYYKNYKGEVSERHVTMPCIVYGHNIYYTNPQWMMHAFDLDKQQWRTFAVHNILGYSIG